MKNYYPGNAYHTSSSNKRDWGDYFALGTRWYFYFNIFTSVLKARDFAIHDKFDNPAWMEISHEMLRYHERSGARCHFMGLENISKHDEPVVFTEFAPPITIAGTGKEEHQYIIDFIQGKLKEWGRSQFKQNILINNPAT